MSRDALWFFGSLLFGVVCFGVTKYLSWKKVPWNKAIGLLEALGMLGFATAFIAVMNALGMIPPGWGQH